MPSLCDQCFAPGACCRRLNFYGGSPAIDGGNEKTYWLDEPIEPQLRAGMGNDVYRPIPFEVFEIKERFIDEETKRPYGKITFSCRNLLPNGRCGDYENRPWLCRVFEPAGDHLCVHYKGAEAGAE